MYKLTVEFKTNQELADFVVKIGGVTPDMNVKHIMPVAAEPVQAEAPVKEKKTKAKKETVVDQGAEVEVPPVIEAPAKKVIDRDSIIKAVTSGIQELSAKGMKGPQLAKELGDIYVQTDCPAGTKIGQLEDDALARFFPAFKAFLAQINGQTLASESQGNFI